MESLRIDINFINSEGSLDPALSEILTFDIP